jgi:hypothetical protein
MEKRRQRQAAKLTAEQSPNTQANEARSFADIKMDMQELEVRFREQVLDEEFEENGQFDPAEGDPYYSDEEIHGYSGSYAQNHNRPSTLLSNSTVPEETDDPVSKQSEEPRHFGGRYDVPFGPVLRAPVDLNGAARIFGRVSRKPWKPSDPFSSISSTISKDNTGGECARQAKLFADFGQKMKTKPCEFGSAHIEEDMLLEDVYPEVPLTFEGGRSTHIGRGTPNNGFSISDEVKLHGGLTKNLLCRYSATTKTSTRVFQYGISTSDYTGQRCISACAHSCSNSGTRETTGIETGTAATAASPATHSSGAPFLEAGERHAKSSPVRTIQEVFRGVVQMPRVWLADRERAG